jgi:hypothetical protein
MRLNRAISTEPKSALLCINTGKKKPRLPAGFSGGVVRVKSVRVERFGGETDWAFEPA